MEVIETPVFSRQIDALLSAEEYRLLQLHFVEQPDAGRIIKRSGGLCKLRWRLPGRGKRGGARVIYPWSARRERLYLLLLYPKNVQDDLTPAQLRILRALVLVEEGPNA